jgi:hypothetical protein
LYDFSWKKFLTIKFWYYFLFNWDGVLVSITLQHTSHQFISG